ncbi:UNVERIFIED_CONTAM: hypothetical protein NCL1_43977 [Trichonephila clavipes]
MNASLYRGAEVKARGLAAFDIVIQALPHGMMPSETSCSYRYEHPVLHFLDLKADGCALSSSPWRRHLSTRDLILPVVS